MLPPSHGSGSSWAEPSLLFHPSLPPAGPRHVDFAFWCQSLELSPPGLPSPDFNLFSPVALVPFLEIGYLES